MLHTQNSLASECIGLAETIRDYPFAPSCLDLELVLNSYRPEELISQTLETICQLLDCSRQNLASTIKEKLDSDRPPIGWDLQIPSLFSRTYQEWFIPFASNYLHKYLPQRDDNAAAPCLQVMHWSQDVWRCWRVLNNQPTLIDSATFGPAQFFVWRLIHDSTHVWQMRCHSRPMFCEDLVRQVAVLAAAQLPPNIFLSVLAELDESIHPHRVFAETEGLAEQFWQSVA